MTPQEGKDAILTVFSTCWNALGYPAVYSDLESKPPTSETVWARATIRHRSGDQASLSDSNGQRIWDNDGGVVIQIFSPVGDGLKSGYAAVNNVVNAYRTAKLAEVWFRNPRFREAGNDGAFDMIIFECNFTYTDVR